LGGVTEHPVGRPPPEPNRRGVPHQPSICRDWIPQGEVRRRARTNRIAGPNFRMPTSSGGYPTAVTSSQRRIPAFKRAPECVEISMANGQQPTDFLRRETTAIGRIGFGRPPFGAEGSVEPTADGRGKRGQEPNASPVATAQWQYWSAGTRELTLQIRDD